MADMTARTAVFRGLNRKPYIADGEMRRMKNLCSDAYPYLSSSRAADEYRFKVSVPAKAGDGYEADTAELPDAAAEHEGAVYRLVPAAAAYTPGEYYYAYGGEWKKGIYEKKFMGAVTEAPSGFRTDLYICTTPKNTDIYGEWRYAGDHNGKIIKWLGKTGGRFVRGGYYVYKSESWEEWIPTDQDYNGFNFEEKNLEKYSTSRWYGYDRKWIGETNEQFTNGERYMFVRKSRGRWQSTAYSYVTAAEMPSAANAADGTQYRYAGAPILQNGAYYRCDEDVNTDGAVYFYSEVEAAAAAEEVTTLPQAAAARLGKVYKYTKETEAGYYICEKTDTGWGWKQTERPSTVKNLTLTEYLNNYYKKFEAASFLAVHEHFGSLAALVKAADGDIWLYYREKCYKVPRQNAEGALKLSSCGDYLLIGECGDYLNTRTEKYTEGDGCFDFAVQCDEFESAASGKIRKSAVTETCLRVYSQDRGLLEKIAEALDKSELTFKLYTDVHRDESLYTTVKLENGEHAAAVEDASSGRKLASGAWLELELYVLSVKIKSTMMRRDFNSEELRIKSVGQEDCVPWKNRLWSYDGGAVRGSVQGIFKESGGIDWTTMDSTGMSAIRRTLWQGGNVTGIAAITGRVVCFKRGYIYTLSGEMPSTMYTSGISCPGLREDNKKSIAVLEDGVFYLSDTGVYVFTGGFPTNISENAGINGTDACGGTDGVKYYLSLKEESGEYAFYVYDVRKRLWHREDSVHALSFTVIDGKVCYCDAQSGKVMVYGSEGAEEWETELEYDEGTWQKKKYKKIIVRGDFEDADVYLSADGEEWRAIGHSTGKEEFPIIPLVCERLKIKIKGTGKCVIKSIDRIFEVIA